MTRPGNGEELELQVQIAALKVRIKELEEEVRRLKGGNRIPDEHNSVTIAKNIDGKRVYLTLGDHADGQLGKVGLKVGKHGDVDAVYGWFGEAVSMGLQGRLTPESFFEKFSYQKVGNTKLYTDDELFPMVDSFVDWVAKRIKHRYFPDGDEQGEENDDGKGVESNSIPDGEVQE